ncbi:1,4-alpha-glucan branching protein GlgB [Hydrogenophaga sp.]|uniref:1,4-alpha-glucan branching protein GlgB n=1 Tax=Hydrogenophaga sp. TaxID=1904254 RepID=UPI0025BBB02D|nr:1,4-alpha-glucan branching protein GlgB [Hydrogenophaga sp.]
MTPAPSAPTPSLPGQQTDPTPGPESPSGRWLGDTDAWLLAEGRHLRPWEKLGAHPTSLDGVAGTAFAVWAPHARQVGLMGDFNGWQPQPMVLRPECGVWELFVPGAGGGAWYKFEVEGSDGRRVLKTDPYARETELPPGNASRVCAPLRSTTAPTADHARLDRAMAVYEVHVGSWRRPGGPDVLPTWDDLAEHLVPYAAGLGFTHLELLPISEHPFYGSWGYQPTGLYAPTARYGSPEAFRRFVAAAHAAGLKVVLDWVPAHFPADEHALARFDGTALYEHEDPREGVHRDWNTLIYNFGRHEVRNFLVGNALFWIEQYGIDGLRVDAVASMLYRDYSRTAGDWIPNRDGGRENYEAIAFLREVHDVLHREAPQAMTTAEESTAFPRVTGPTAQGGLGFDHKWNMGWMHDVLSYLALDPVHRRWHHHKLTFAMMYAHSEDYVLPLSHDEVVYGKGSLLGKMAGDRWQQLANLRALYCWMYAHPGKKLLFMGAELAQPTEWNHDGELPWALLQDPAHAGIHRLVGDLNHAYRASPALFARDSDPQSFQWLVVDDAEQSVLAFARYGHRPEDTVVVVANFTPLVRHGYRVGLPHSGAWREVLNTDSFHYGGGNVGNDGHMWCDDAPLHGQDWSAALTLPPLAVLWLQPERP